MGRALDNAMLNVGLKDVARGSISIFYTHISTKTGVRGSQRPRLSN